MSFLSERLNIKVFLLSLAIGLLICYLTIPTPEIVFAYPNPDNLDNVYKKEDGNCYKYTSEEVNCSVKSIETPK